jgi:hypothetical protein
MINFDDLFIFRSILIDIHIFGRGHLSEFVDLYYLLSVLMFPKLMLTFDGYTKPMLSFEEFGYSVFLMVRFYVTHRNI